MAWRPQYEQAKSRLLVDTSICSENRELFREFFAFEEYKLKRRNGLPDLDDGCCKTLYAYILWFRNANTWFNNVPWAALNKEDIRRVYDALEDGTIRTRKGVAFRDRASYYNKIFKSKPFRLAGKAELAREVIEFSTKSKPVVRFTTEAAFRTLVSAVANPKHLLLFWLAWDIGENIDTLLKLTKRDFVPQSNRVSGDREYLVNLPQEKLKRSRRSRSEVTLYLETVRYADMVLPDLSPDVLVFAFGYRYANKLMQSTARRTRATSMPHDEPIRWKDLRSGMACHLLRSGWSRDEVNARLGHTPHSDALDAYINYLALDRDKPKQRMLQSTTEALQTELAEAKRTVLLTAERARMHADDNAVLIGELQRSRQDIEDLRSKVHAILRMLDAT